MYFLFKMGMFQPATLVYQRVTWTPKICRNVEAGTAVVERVQPLVVGECKPILGGIKQCKSMDNFERFPLKIVHGDWVGI